MVYSSTIDSPPFSFLISSNNEAKSNAPLRVLLVSNSFTLRKPFRRQEIGMDADAMNSSPPALLYVAFAIVLALSYTVSCNIAVSVFSIWYINLSPFHIGKNPFADTTDVENVVDISLSPLRISYTDAFTYGLIQSPIWTSLGFGRQVPLNTRTVSFTSTKLLLLSLL